MRAELHSAYAQLRAASAERNAARAEASAATAHVAALQADLRAADHMDKVRAGHHCCKLQPATSGYPQARCSVAGDTAGAR